MTTAGSPPELLQAVVDLGRGVFGAAACSVAVLEPDEGHLVFRAASGAGADEVVGLRLPVNHGIAGWAVSSGQPIVIGDVRADPRFARDLAESTGYVPRSILAAPLQTPRALVGVVEVLDRTPASGRDDLALLGLLAAQAALAVEATTTETSRPVGALAAAAADLGAFGAAEQQAAAGLLREFVTYLRRRGGPTRLV
jgi:GAF domain-containing protein